MEKEIKSFDSWTPEERKLMADLVQMEIFKKFRDTLESQAQHVLDMLQYIDLSTQEGICVASRNQGVLNNISWLNGIFEDLTKPKEEPNG